jgi:NAD+ kinase
MAKPSRTKARETGGKESAIGRVLVLADGEKREVRELVPEIVPWLSERVREVRVERDVRAFPKARQAADPGEPRPDLVVVLGGDGAILSAVRAYAATPVPTLGINFGHVGFLASTESSHWRDALGEILEGRAVVEPRMRIEAELDSQSGERVRAVALNDVVVTRGAYQGMLSFALQVGEDWLTNYRADGLIVASPSGSTAYSLAAGGPVLAPQMEALVVTPICPQALSHRPIVLHADSVLRLVLTRASGLTTLVVDGQGFYTMRVGDSVVLRRHAVAYPLLARPGFDPYKRLRDRLGWRGSFQPDVFPPETEHPVPDEGEAGGL